jgi:cob(I)alamin adenosyltransferase
MVKLTKIYTRGGDGGKTSLGDGSRVNKTSARVDAYGEVDETNSVIGIVRLHSEGEADEMLASIQNDLFDLGADLCTPEKENPDYPPLRITQSQVDRLEENIDRLNADLSTLNSFILPGGSQASSYLHLSRTVCRRAERKIVLLSDSEKINPLAVTYINRLSDFLFVLGRYLNNKGKEDVLWVPGANR